MNARPIVAFAACVAITTAACGARQPEPRTAASPAVGSATPPAPARAGKPWNDLSHEERLALMKTSVFPRMQEAFQGFDPKRFADFSCKTCHGEGAMKGAYDMPNPKLPKLDSKGEFKEEMDVHPEITKFMMTTVVSTMAGILEMPKYDPATKSGFGCHNCHMVD